MAIRMHLITISNQSVPGQLEAEHGFRDLKSELLLRPVFHRLEHRIRAHVLICWLALLLTRVAERSAGQTWRNIRRETSRLKQVTLTGPAGTITQTTPLRPEQKAIYQALSITPPPPSTPPYPAPAPPASVDTRPRPAPAHTRSSDHRFRAPCDYKLRSPGLPGR